MPETLVSIAMITYNHAPFIAEAIEGILNQKTNFPFELVIGEDCSTDSTREIVLKYQEKHPDIIRVITSNTNVGMIKNHLRTLKACRGKYLAFCEGDDYWHHPEKLQKQVKHLESHAECGMVFSNYDVYHITSRKRISQFINYRKWVMPEVWTIGDIVENKGDRSRAIATCTVMFRRDICERIIEADPYLHQSGQFLMGDTQLWAEMAAHSQLHYIPESLATHNIIDESATRSKDIRKVLQFGISGAKLQLYLCDKYNLPSHTRHKYQEYLLNRLLRLAFHTRNRELADEVRITKKRFTLKEWLRYYGAKNMVVHSFYHTLALFLSLFRRTHGQWH